MSAGGPPLRCFLPGPVAVRRELLDAMIAGPVIHHRGAEFEALFEGLQPGLGALFGTARRVAVLVGSATAAMEMGVRALPEGPILALVNGAFSERFVAICRAIGREVEPLEVPWGRTHDPDDVARALRRRRFAGMTVVHCETSTGALQPLGELVERAGGLPVVADAVSSVGGVEVAFDRWGLAFACGASQKALGLPAGLALVAASDSLLRAGARSGSLYLDLCGLDANAARSQPPFTPSLPLLYALACQLGRIAREPLPARFRRHAALAREFSDWAMRKGARLLADGPSRSPTVSCVSLPDGARSDLVVAALARRGFLVAQGYGKLAATTIRVGHMGDMEPEELRALLPALEEAAGWR